MDYKFLFIVTSAIIPFKTGSANTESERYEQTLNTISSIRNKVPNSIILLVESSQSKLPDDYRKEIIKRTDSFIECYDDQILKQIYDNLEKNPHQINFGKSLLESRGMIIAFEKILKTKLYQNVHRIFKISGRYFLNDTFEIEDYQSRCLYNFYVFNICKYNDSEYEYFRDLIGIDGQLVTGLWSFCSSLMTETYELYQKAFSYIDWILSINNCIDIERCLYKFIDMNKVIHMQNLGVTQIHGPNGEWNNL
jgi:hypothetical protein